MKRIANYLIALALMAFAFTSCEDVPSPFGQIVKPSGDDPVSIEPVGSGTQADPYNVAAVIEYLSGLGADVPSPTDVYIKGYISSITETFGTQYGNATFEISDTKDGANKFLCYRVKYFGGQSYSDPTALNIKEGDEVIICGKVVNYKGNTPETSANAAYVYSINGQGGSGGGGSETGDAKGKGTQDDPFNIAAAIKKCKEIGETASTEKYYVKGIVVEGGTVSGGYGNVTFKLGDAKGATDVFTAFQVAGSDGEKLADGYEVPVDAEVVVYGPMMNYKGNTPETAGKSAAQIVTINGKKTSEGGGGDTPDPSGVGDGTENNPYNVIAAIAKGEQTGAWVKAFIVGFVDGQAYETGATFSSAATGKSNILIAASADETNPAKCMPVQLPNGDVRTKLNLQDNAGNYKKEVLLYGDITAYFKVPGLKNTSYAVIDGVGVGTKPGGGGGDTPSGGEGADGSKIVTIADFNAAPESNDVWYQLTGTVKNLKDGDQYGNFDLEDATGSVYVYGLLSEKGGEKKKFQDLVAAKGIKNGSKITIVGVRGSYNGKIEVMNAYFISIEGETGGGGSGATTGADGSTIISVADFNAAAESNDVWYQLTGTVKNLKDGDQYGNFDLEDATGSVYVYGLLATKGGEKKKFQDLVTAKGIANGKKITIVGNRGSYNGKIEVMNAYFIKIE